MKRIIFSLIVPTLLPAQVLFADPLPVGLEEKLRGGEIVLQDTRTDEAGGAGKAQVYIHGDAQAFWDVIVSCELAFVFVDGLRECEVLEDSGDRAVIRQVVKKHWLLPAITFSFESLRKPYDEITFSLLQGDLDIMEGSWLFTPLSGGVLVDYEARIKPAFPVPRWLIRRTIRKDTPDLIACIRGLAGVSGSEQMLESDRERCPGDQ